MAGLTKVFVGNLSFTTKEPELASEFAAAGKVVNANIITRGPRSLGYGFVEFATEQEAQNAVKVMDKKEVQGRQVNVELARPQDEIKKKEEQEQKSSTRGSSRGGRGGFRGRGRGRGRRTFRRRDQVGEENKQTSPQQGGKTEKPSTNNNNNEGGEKKEKKPKQPREKKVNENREESKTTLFVANLPFSLDDAAFGKFITDLTLKFKTAHVVTKRNGRSKGYGFVEFDTHEDQQKALQAIDKKEVEGRPLSVKVALTEPPKAEEKKDEKKDEKKEEKKDEKKEPVKKEEKKDEKPATKETKKEDKPAQKETKKEEKKETAKSPQVDKKETKPAAKETKSPQQQKK